MDYTVQYIGLIKSFSQMTFRVHETNGTVTHDENLTYQVTGNSGGIINVNFTLTSSGNSPVSTSAQVNSNNDTVLSFTFGSYTFTGQNAKSEFDGFMALFGLEETFSGQLSIFTASAYFHSTGTAPMTFGTTTFDVTTWVANTLPLDVSQCGYSATITAYTLQFGTPPNTSLTFITYLHVATSSPNNEDVTFQLISMTQA